MKKIFGFFMASFAMTTIQAQDINDAMRYAQDNQTGTARFSAMSGAFGALGGDFSSISVNPAGSSVFANNQVGATLGVFSTKNNSNYFGTNSSENDSKFDLSQAGGVYIFENEDHKSDWKKFALALNYENTKNLDNSIYSAGINPTNSLANYFLSYANGVPLSVADGTDYYFGNMFFNEQQAYLGYQSYMINSTDDTNPNNTAYTSNVPVANYFQESLIESRGYNGKLSFNASTVYKDKLMIGINLNSHFTDYRQSSTFYEENDYNNTTTTDVINRVRFNNELYTYGNGFSFQVGTIYKATKEFRLGLAYQSPTWYRLNDELTQNISSVRGNVDGELPAQIVDPQLTMVYDAYRLQTPGKWTGSLAYVFGKRGLISFDYTLKDYSNTKFQPKTDFTATNNLMSNVLTATNEFRIGAEYKIEKFSLRGGYRFEESPYKNGKTIGDLTGYSTGIGYNFGEFKIDLAYAFSQRDYQQRFFSQGLTDAANVKAKNNNVNVTVLFEL
ncbi:outer membrane protein transport protein [Flavobacterium sp.]|uniref:OmpP1/FadL family transporter n=1 Tax=Flavobacterium sp. TaxID=239 RepID=UPI002603C22C|nr:outer membrane protein transport protein [Flavobacterium sp.]